MNEYRLKIVVFALTGPVCPKISGRRGRPTNHSSFHKSMINGFFFMWYKNVGTSFLRFVTNNAFDIRTNGRTDGRADGQTALS